VQNPKTSELVAEAVQQAFDDWAGEHPTLASVISRTNLTIQTVSRLRESDEYRRALEDYHRSGDETGLLNRLVDLAGPILTTLLAG